MTGKRGPRSQRGSSGKATSKPRKSTAGGGVRSAHKRVKTNSQRTASSARWLERQINDPYVAAAKAEGYRSRAAFKLIDLDARFALLKRGTRVVDLGAAPGGWTQVAVARVGAGRRGGGTVYAIDLNEMAAVEGAVFEQADIANEEDIVRLLAALSDPIDLVLSDMAPPTTGHTATDHLRIMVLCELAAVVAEKVLRPGGDFVAKVLQGGAERAFLSRLKKSYVKVKHVKPAASRAESSELYLVAQGFRGGDNS